MAYTGRMFIDCEGCMAVRGGKLASLKGKGKQILRNLKGEGAGEGTKSHVLEVLWEEILPLIIQHVREMDVIKRAWLRGQGITEGEIIEIWNRVQEKPGVISRSAYNLRKIMGKEETPLNLR